MTLRSLLPMALLLACSGTPDRPGPDTGDTGTAGSSALQITTRQAEHAQAVWWVEWEAPAGADSWVEVGGIPTAAQSGGGPVAFPLVGLKQGHDHAFRAVSTVAGTEVSATGTIETVLPENMSTPTLQASAPGSKIGAGYVQYSQIEADGETWLIIVDHEGDVVWYRRGFPGTMIVTSKEPLDPADVIYTEWDLAQDDDVGRMIRVSFDGAERTDTRLQEGHHDVVEWEDGTIGYLAYAPDPLAQLATDAIKEVPEGADDLSTPAQIFSYLEDYPHPPWFVCEHMDGWTFNGQWDEWTHSNSLMRDEAENYLVMSKFHDSLLKIDRTTGAVLWQLNGRYGDFTLTDGGPTWSALGDTELFSHAHMSEYWDMPPTSGWDACMLVFDNGSHYAVERSTVKEICLDEGTMTAEVVRVYDPGEGGFTHLMGDARRLDGNLLVGWAGLSLIEEVDPQDQVMWRLELGDAAVAGRVRFRADLGRP